MPNGQRTHGDRQRLQEAELRAASVRNHYRQQVRRLEEELRAAQEQLLTAEETLQQISAEVSAEFAPKG